MCSISSKNLKYSANKLKNSIFENDNSPIVLVKGKKGGGGLALALYFRAYIVKYGDLGFKLPPPPQIR